MTSDVNKFFSTKEKPSHGGTLKKLATAVIPEKVVMVAWDIAKSRNPVTPVKSGVPLPISGVADLPITLIAAKITWIMPLIISPALIVSNSFSVSVSILIPMILRKNRRS